MRKNNPRVGDLAVKKGYLSALQAQDLHREQRTVDMFFGDLAVHKGLMTQEELDEVLSHQKKNRIRLGDAIVFWAFRMLKPLNDTPVNFTIYRKTGPR